MGAEHQLRFLPIDSELTQALSAGVTHFEEKYSAQLGECADIVDEIAVQMNAFYESVPRPAPWIGYFAVDENTRKVIGTAAFKSAPFGDQEIEIAYSTFKPFENKGYATAMAGKLVGIAAASTAVQKVLAHTLPEPNASTHVLQKNGFAFHGEVIDPEDGRVWRWEKPLAPSYQG